jgi:hypothetical protein
MVAVAELRRRDASVWSVLAKDKGEPDHVTKSINFNTHALGRDAGVVSFFRRRPPNDAGGGRRDGPFLLQTRQAKPVRRMP